MPVSEHLLERWKAWKMGGAICSEMEASAIFIISSILRKRAGGIMLIAANQERNDPNAPIVRTLDNLIATSIEAVKILIERDRQAGAV
jgi:uridine phosphorylase